MEKPRSRVDTYYAVDLDRCLVDTDKLQAFLEQIVSSQSAVTHEQMQQAYLETIKTGGSFDTVAFLKNVLSVSGEDEDLDRILKIFVQRARSIDMCEPDAREFLRLLDEMNAFFGIVTYGSDVWQKTKMEAARLDHIPSLVTDIKEKGHVLATWRQPDGTFTIPQELTGKKSLIAGSVVLIDDKAISFRDIPEGVSGIHVLPHDGRELLASQQGSLPEGVVAVRGLAGVIELLKDRNV